jgi:hypothetical protein
MSPLIAFYRGLATDTEGRMVSELWELSDQEMEEFHDFIQWLFPLREPSRFNPDAPLLTNEDVREFRNDPALRANLRKSFDRFLAFLGLTRDADRIVARDDQVTAQAVWRYPNHNWLRVTRVLHSLRLLGLEPEARAFFECLRTLEQGGKTGITHDTFRFWDDAANRNVPEV